MRILDFIIAEDIRFEAGNKFSIMGIYSEEIRLNLPEDIQWPIPYRFGIYIRLEVEDSDVYPNRFILKVGHNDTIDAQFDGNIEFIVSTHTISIPLVIFPFPLPSYGIFRFDFEIYKDESLLITETQKLNILSQ